MKVVKGCETILNILVFKLVLVPLNFTEGFPLLVTKDPEDTINGCLEEVVWVACLAFPDWSYHCATNPEPVLADPVTKASSVPVSKPPAALKPIDEVVLSESLLTSIAFPE